MINPADIDINRLPWVPFHRLKDLPSIPAIYFCLVYPGKPVYIGETGNLWKRWIQHDKTLCCRDRGAISLAWLSEVPTDGYARRQIEKALIRHYRPELNAQLRNHRVRFLEARGQTA